MPQGDGAGPPREGGRGKVTRGRPSRRRSIGAMCVPELRPQSRPCSRTTLQSTGVSKMRDDDVEKLIQQTQ